ncbi:hypothetical protein AVEN_229876-1 [Araneus ventricosus]|uniref:STPR domain-containing protein n=1 Tax=Araneus ventricosus TaxID=182803 RepID=A0A4Y2RCG0_ARAVE|nr:hypothetical protein AVEN_180757-1 [Araneus ventricosus]GBN72516.1 hypothetical protein AVEN_229876-1 [Araneus ventricosus]
MPKRKRGITGDAASRREAIRKRERRVVETEEERSRRLSTMPQRGQDRRAEETEEQRNRRLSDMAQRGQERRAEETEEQRNRRLPVMGQRGKERRAEETEEQRNSRLSVMLQHARERRLNVIEGQNHQQIQTFYAARTVLYPIVEEHNCGEMDNLCLKCGGLYFRDERNTRGIYTNCCHNGNIIEQASVYPVEMKGLMDGSDELSVHFKNNIRSYQCFNGCTDCTVYRERSVLLQNSWPNLSQDLSSTPS